jgi:hypothetical protein
LRASTSFQTTCIQSSDKLKVGFALENAAEAKVLVRNENELYKSCPGNIQFMNIKFSNNGEEVKLKLDPSIDQITKSCFSWFGINVDNGLLGSACIGSYCLTSSNTKNVEFITKDPSKRNL